jgi:hypothetical protein
LTALSSLCAFDCYCSLALLLHHCCGTGLLQSNVSLDATRGTSPVWGANKRLTGQSSTTNTSFNHCISSVTALLFYCVACSLAPQLYPTLQ